MNKKMSNKGYKINPKIIRNIRIKENLSQEALAEKSFQKHCYLPVATIKRAEAGYPVSCTTLNKYSEFFQIDSKLILVDEREKPTDKTISLHKPSAFVSSTINWELALSLAGNERNTRLAKLCRELYDLLTESADDKILHSPFMHGQ